MEAWLECSVAPGQFTGEYAVKIETSDGQSVSLFVPTTTVDVKNPPQSGRFISGQLRVELVSEREGVALVCLPRETLENVRHITVNTGALRQEA